MTSVAMPLLGSMGQSRESPSPARRASTQQQSQPLQNQQQGNPSRSKSFSVTTSRNGHSPSQRNGNGPVSSPSRSPPTRTSSNGQPSPENNSNNGTTKIKTEEPSSSSNVTSARPRPRKLDLSSGRIASRGPQTAGNLGAKDSNGLALKDLGVACLSPGFQTKDPTMREQLQRSLSVKEQQRQLIEARQKGTTAKPFNAQDQADPSPQQRAPDGMPLKESSTFRRKGPPPGLSINSSTAAGFANERVVQSAPINQTFTGLRRGTQHLHHPSSLTQSSHPQQQPPQTSNRLPPISDVFANERLEPPSAASFRSGYPQGSGSIRSPGFAPPSQTPQSGPQPSSSRSREFRSAEEAVQGMSGGREDLLPKMVHYGGVQPPTPPSPMPTQQQQQQQQQQAPQQQYAPHSNHSAPYHPNQGPPAHADYRSEYSRNNSIIGRRRPRDEYERDNGGSPATQHGSFKRHAHDEGDWRAEMNSREKRDEFMRLCERAWDLFHS